MDFSNGLLMLSGIFMILIFINFLNEKVVKLPTEIGMMTITLCMAIVIIILEALNITAFMPIAEKLHDLNLHDIVLDGFLCFLLFSGSAKIKLKDLNQDKLLIVSLSFISTLIATLIYAGLAMIISRVVNVPLSFIESCILGSIISPTDPISAMSILKKAGLPERLSTIIEGESLFNDGIAVALFVTFTSLLHSTGGNPTFTFIGTIGWNVFGAVGVGVLVSFLLFIVFKKTNQKFMEILVSLAAVTAAYGISETLEVSGATSAVIVGIYFATHMNKLHEDNENYYFNFYTFWHVIDKILNAVLYMLIGVALIFLHQIDGFFIISISAVIMALVARFISIIGPIAFFGRDGEKNKAMYTPQVRNKNVLSLTQLLTWAGLKGGICIALALGTQTIFATDKFYFVVTSTYAVVVFTTLVQGLTVQKVYNRLKEKLF